MERGYPTARLIALAAAVLFWALTLAQSAAAHGGHDPRMAAAVGPAICAWYCPAPDPRPIPEDECCGHCPAPCSGSLLAILPGIGEILPFMPRRMHRALQAQARLAALHTHSPYLARGPPRP